MKRYLTLLLIAFVCSCDFQDDPTIPASVWEIAKPGEVGFDEEQLLQLNQNILEGVYGSINSLIIVKDDKLIFENYYDNSRLDQIEVFGSTVSVAAILAGIAMEQDLLPGMDTPIRDLLSDQAPFDNQLRAQITFRHLLDMRTGIAWNEFLRPFNDPQNSANQMQLSLDWAAFTLDQPMEAVPGGRFAYNSGASMIFSSILQQRTGEPLSTFAEENLFNPLGIEYTWTADPSGVTNAGWGLRITATDLTKIGYLVLNEGSWFGDRIISSEFIQEMTSIQSEFNFTNDFALSWWRFSNFSSFVEGLEQNDIAFTWGAGGQFVFVIPHQNMVVASTASNFGQDVSSQITFNMLFEEILPALNDITDF